MQQGYRSSAPKSVGQDVISRQQTQMRNPPIEGDRFAYGVITEINDQNQVKVQLYNRRDANDNELLVLGGKFIPLATQQSDILLKYGRLRKGLQVLVHWRGQQRATWAIAHIIGDEELNILEEESQSDDISGPPMAFLSGGMTDF